MTKEEFLNHKYPINLEGISQNDRQVFVMFRDIFNTGYNLAKEEDSDLLKALQDLVKLVNDQGWCNDHEWQKVALANRAIVKAGGSI